MRKFYLQNSLGERIDLNDVDKYILTSPGGLGLQFGVNQADIQNGFYKRTKIDNPSIQITGDITFVGSDPYADYRKLVNWLNSGNDFSVVYVPYGSEEYLCDVNIESLSKTEINDGSKLTCSLICIGRTPWYKPNAKLINIVPDSVESSTWDLEWDVVWSQDATAGETSVQASGHLPSAVKAVINGAIYNPKIILLKNGTEVAKMELDKTVQSGETLTFSSLYTGAGVWIDGVSQLPYLDLANDNFFRIPLGEGYSLRITSDSSVSISGTISIYDYYRSV
jgi:hypothetical protein